MILTGTGPTFSFATPSPLGVLVATASATDSDGSTVAGNARRSRSSARQGAHGRDRPGWDLHLGRGAVVSTTPLAGADVVILQVLGSNVLVDASTATSPVEDSMVTGATRH